MDAEKGPEEWNPAAALMCGLQKLAKNRRYSWLLTHMWTADNAASAADDFFVAACIIARRGCYPAVIASICKIFKTVLFANDTEGYANAMQQLAFNMGLGIGAGHTSLLRMFKRNVAINDECKLAMARAVCLHSRTDARSSSSPSASWRNIVLRNDWPVNVHQTINLLCERLSWASQATAEVILDVIRQLISRPVYFKAIPPHHVASAVEVLPSFMVLPI
jgi:hypothetical protein